MDITINQHFNNLLSADVKHKLPGFRAKGNRKLLDNIGVWLVFYDETYVPLPSQIFRTCKQSCIYNYLLRKIQNYYFSSL